MKFICGERARHSMTKVCSFRSFKEKEFQMVEEDVAIGADDQITRIVRKYDNIDL